MKEILRLFINRFLTLSLLKNNKLFKKKIKTINLKNKDYPEGSP
jgi:hypothetical protein